MSMSKDRYTFIVVLAICLAELAVGILLLINHESFTSLILTVLGAIAAVWGIVCIVRYFRTPMPDAILKQDLFKGLVCLGIGVVCIFQFKWVAQMSGFMTTLYGAAAMLCGIVKIQWSVDLLRLKRKFWYLAAIGAVISLAMGGVILANPFADINVTWVLIGLAFLVGSLPDIAATILGNRPMDAKPAAAAATSVPAPAAAAQPAVTEQPAAPAAAAPQPESAPEPAPEPPAACDAPDAAYEPVEEPGSAPTPSAMAIEDEPPITLRSPNE